MAGLFVRYRDVLGALLLTLAIILLTVRRMSDDRKSGIALIAGSAGMIITMILHPTGRFAPGQLELMIRKLFAVHSLALASLPVLFLGAWGLTRRVARPDRIAVMALVFYGFALAAILTGAVFDGLVLPNVIREVVSATGAAGDQWRLVFRYNTMVDGEFVRVFAVSSAAAILLWSMSVLRNRELSRAVACYGCILGVVIVTGVFTGFLKPDTHQFILTIFGEALWFISSGVQLWQSKEAQSSLGH